MNVLNQLELFEFDERQEKQARSLIKHRDSLISRARKIESELYLVNLRIESLHREPPKHRSRRRRPAYLTDKIRSWMRNRWESNQKTTFTTRDLRDELSIPTHQGFSLVGGLCRSGEAKVVSRGGKGSRVTVFAPSEKFLFGLDSKCPTH